jgi:hypothetical protein
MKESNPSMRIKLVNYRNNCPLLFAPVPVSRLPGPVRRLPVYRIPVHLVLVNKIKSFLMISRLGNNLIFMY